MAMERMTISMNAEDIDLFERYRTDMKMTKSAFVRLLLAEHTNNIPGFIKNQNLIKEVSNLNISVKELLLVESVDDTTKIQILEEIKELNQSVKKMA